MKVTKEDLQTMNKLPSQEVQLPLKPKKKKKKDISITQDSLLHNSSIFKKQQKFSLQKD